MGLHLWVWVSSVCVCVCACTRVCVFRYVYVCDCVCVCVCVLFYCFFFNEFDISFFTFYHSACLDRSCYCLIHFYPFTHYSMSLSDQIWNDIKSGAALRSPKLLSRFLLLTYAVSISGDLVLSICFNNFELLGCYVCTIPFFVVLYCEIE